MEFISNKKKPKQQTFLIRPMDRVIVREDPMYDRFALERLTQELNHQRDKATSDDYPADTPEEFIRKVIADDQFGKIEGTIIIGKQIRRPGWVRIEAPENSTIDELWKLAMAKVEQKDFIDIHKQTRSK